MIQALQGMLRTSVFGKAVKTVKDAGVYGRRGGVLPSAAGKYTRPTGKSRPLVTSNKSLSRKRVDPPHLPQSRGKKVGGTRAPSTGHLPGQTANWDPSLGARGGWRGPKGRTVGMSQSIPKSHPSRAAPPMYGPTRADYNPKGPDTMMDTLWNNRSKKYKMGVAGAGLVIGGSMLNDPQQSTGRGY